MKRILTICCALLLAMLMLSATALAEDAKVTFVNEKEKFTFAPGSEFSVSDLFPNFKMVMPGDTLEQKITVQNKSAMQVRIYIQAKEDVQEPYGEFLDQLHMTVKAENKKIFDAAADEKGGLAKRKLLGTFKQKGKTELTVTLEVPIELGNEHMNKLGIIPWTFIVEEIPEDTTPHTGDWYQSALWLSVAGLLLLAIVLVLLAKRRARRAQ